MTATATRTANRTNARAKSTLLVELAAAAELWHTAGQGDAYATLPVADHREHWPIRSLTFRRWLGPAVLSRSTARPPVAKPCRMP